MEKNKLKELLDKAFEDTYKAHKVLHWGIVLEIDYEEILKNTLASTISYIKTMKLETRPIKESIFKEVEDLEFCTPLKPLTPNEIADMYNGIKVPSLESICKFDEQNDL